MEKRKLLTFNLGALVAHLTFLSSKLCRAPDQGEHSRHWGQSCQWEPSAIRNHVETWTHPRAASPWCKCAQSTALWRMQSSSTPKWRNYPNCYSCSLSIPVSWLSVSGETPNEPANTQTKTPHHELVRVWIAKVNRDSTCTSCSYEKWHSTIFLYVTRWKRLGSEVNLRIVHIAQSLKCELLGFRVYAISVLSTAHKAFHCPFLQEALTIIFVRDTWQNWNWY